MGNQLDVEFHCQDRKALRKDDGVRITDDGGRRLSLDCHLFAFFFGRTKNPGNPGKSLKKY